MILMYKIPVKEPPGNDWIEIVIVEWLNFFISIRLDQEWLREMQLQYGASVAKWLAHLPFTSEAAGSSLSEYSLNATRTQSLCEESKSQRSAVDFPRVLRFPPTGKVDRVG